MLGLDFPPLASFSRLQVIPHLFLQEWPGYISEIHPGKAERFQRAQTAQFQQEISAKDHPRVLSTWQNALLPRKEALHSHTDRPRCRSPLWNSSDLIRKAASQATITPRYQRLMHSSSEQEMKHPQKRLLNRDQELQPHPSFLPRFSCSPGMSPCFCHLSFPGPGPALLMSFWNSLKKTDSSHLMVSWTNFCSQEETSHCRTLKYWHSGMWTLPQIHSYQRPPGVEPQLPALNNDRAGPSPDPAGRGSQAQGAAGDPGQISSSLGNPKFRQGISMF